MGLFKKSRTPKSSKAQPENLTTPPDYDCKAGTSQAVKVSQHGAGEQHKPKPRKRDVLQKYLRICCPYRLLLRCWKLSRDDKIVIGGLVFTGWSFALIMIVLGLAVLA
ncbi:hypothetical protein BJX65DRAFT_306211 [Aspergillus insuetus]